MPYKVSCKPWEVVSEDLLFLKNKTLLCIVDHYGKSPIVRAGSLTADDLVKAAKIVFTEFGFPKKIISHAGMNLTSEIISQFYRQINTE